MAYVLKLDGADQRLDGLPHRLAEPLLQRAPRNANVIGHFGNGNAATGVGADEFPGAHRDTAEVPPDGSRAARNKLMGIDLHNSPVLGQFNKDSGKTEELTLSAPPRALSQSPKELFTPRIST